MIKIILFFLPILCFAQKIDPDQLRELALKYVKPIESKKLFDKNKLALGRYLFIDKKLSKDSFYTCNSCHNIKNFAMDGISNPFEKVDSKDLPEKRNTISLYNASLNFKYGWLADYKNLNSIITMKLLSPIYHRLSSEEELMKSIDKKKYFPYFQLAYSKTKNPYSFKNLVDALSYFVQSLVRPARMDDFLSGDNSALTKTEKRGFKIFIEKGCINCHDGRNFGGTKMEKMGVKSPYKSEDTGLYSLTKNEKDKYYFRVPSLRNITKTAPYFHDGKSANLESTISTMANIQLGIKLNNNEVDYIKQFLDSLTQKARY